MSRVRGGRPRGTQECEYQSPVQLEMLGRGGEQG